MYMMSPELRDKIIKVKANRPDTHRAITKDDLFDKEKMVEGYATINDIIDTALAKSQISISKAEKVANGEAYNDDIKHTKRNKDVADEMERAMMDHEYVSGYRATKQIKLLRKSLSGLRSLLVHIKAFQDKNGGVILPLIQSKRSKVEAEIQSILSLIEEIKNSSGEAFVMHGAMQLREWHRELHDEAKGKMVETESVSEKALRVEDTMRKGGVILLHGPPGTGKTELAKYVAQKLMREKLEKSNPKPVLSSPSQEETEAEVAYLNTIPKIEKDKGYVNSSDYIAIRSKYDTFNAARQNRLVAYGKEREKRQKEIDREVAHDSYRIVSGYKEFQMREMTGGKTLTTTEKGQMETPFLYGPMYECMSKGIPFIIDEANFISPEVMGKLNDLLTMRPGQTVRVQENGGREIKIAEGFCFVLTGNIGTNYQGRHRFESSLYNRVTLDLPYDYLPESEAWQIMLAYFMDEKGRMHMIENDMESMKDLSKAMRYAQDVFEGHIAVNDMPNAAGTMYDAGYVAQMVKNNPISMRDMFNILSAYREDMSHSIEYYIMRDFIMTEKAGGESRKVYINIFQKFGFFKEIIDSTYTVKSNVKGETNIEIDQDKLKIEVAMRRSMIAQGLRTYSTRDTVELAFGAVPNMTEPEVENITSRYESLLTPEAKSDLELEKKRAELVAEQEALKASHETLKRSNEEAMSKAYHTIKGNQGKLKEIQAGIAQEVRDIISTFNLSDDEVTKKAKTEAVSAKEKQASDIGLSIESLEQSIFNINSNIEVYTVDYIIADPNVYGIDTAISIGISIIEDLTKIRDKQKDLFDRYGRNYIPSPESSPSIALQYKQQLDTLKAIGLLDSTGSYVHTYTDHAGNHKLVTYTIPTLAEIEQRLESKKDLLEQKSKQGFTRLLIVPNGLPLTTYIEKLKEATIKAAKVRQVQVPDLDSDGKPKIDRQGNTVTKTIDQHYIRDTQGKEAIFNISDLVDTNPVYTDRSKWTSHGVPEDQYTRDSNGFTVHMIEEDLDLPRANANITIGNRKRIEANQTPQQYIDLLKANPPPYQGESGMTTQDMLTLYTQTLHAEKKVMDNYSNGISSGSLATASYNSTNQCVSALLCVTLHGRWFLVERPVDRRYLHISVRVSVRV